MVGSFHLQQDIFRRPSILRLQQFLQTGLVIEAALALGGIDHGGPEQPIDNPLHLVKPGLEEDSTQQRLQRVGHQALLVPAATALFTAPQEQTTTNLQFHGQQSQAPFTDHLGPQAAQLPFRQERKSAIESLANRQTEGRIAKELQTLVVWKAFRLFVAVRFVGQRLPKQCNAVKLVTNAGAEGMFAVSWLQGQLREGRKSIRKPIVSIHNSPGTGKPGDLQARIFPCFLPERFSIMSGFHAQRNGAMGMFITLEGIEGSGKSTQMQRIAAYLRQRGQTVLTTREPGGCAIADAIRQILLHPANTAMVPRAELLLYAAARAQHVAEVIRPALDRGEVVLCDRFLDATIAYQGYGRGLDLGLIEQLNTIATDDLLPELTLLLDMPAEEGLLRARRRNADSPAEEGRFEAEALDFHHRVRTGYLDLARRQQRFRVIDASGTPEEVGMRLLEALQRFFPVRQ